MLWFCFWIVGKLHGTILPWSLWHCVLNFVTNLRLNLCTNGCITCTPSWSLTRCAHMMIRFWDLTHWIYCSNHQVQSPFVSNDIMNLVLKYINSKAHCVRLPWRDYPFQMWFLHQNVKDARQRMCCQQPITRRTQQVGLLLSWTTMMMTTCGHQMKMKIKTTSTTKRIGKMTTCRGGDMWQPQVYGGPCLGDCGLTDITNGGSNNQHGEHIQIARWLSKLWIEFWH